MASHVKGETVGAIFAIMLLICFGWVGVGNAQTAFTKITSESGIAEIVKQKYRQNPKWWLSGLHLADLDGDGDLDFFMSAHGGGGAVAALNDGAGHFTLAPGAYPASEIHLYYDCNEDGLLDLTMTYQDGGGQWWLNKSRPGKLSFQPTDITRGTNTARRQAMIDINRDGKVDWLRGSGSGIQFDFGDGKGDFTASSRTLSVPCGRSECSAMYQDIDGDGDIDLLAEWGHYESPKGNSRIYRNDGDMNFTDVATEAGRTGKDMSIKGVGDFDQDGDPDLIVLEDKQRLEIYLNDGAGHFTKKPGAISGGEGGFTMASWGLAVATDFDNDGIADIIVNGKNFLKILRGTGGGNFTYMNTAWGIKDTAASSVDDGLCFGDIDGDGDLDVIGYRTVWPERFFDVYRNDLPRRNWIRVRPIGRAGNKGAAGAKIRIYAAGAQQLLWYEQVAIYDHQAAQSYYGLAKTERHFGLGSRNTADINVEFYPSGKIVWRRGVTANQAMEIYED
jgi:hypothetical protein